MSAFGAYQYLKLCDFNKYCGEPIERKFELVMKQSNVKQMPLQNLHKQTRASAGRLAISTRSSDVS